MIGLLAKMIGVENYSANQKRSAYGKICGGVGIFLNILLFVGKFAIRFQRELLFRDEKIVLWLIYEENWVIYYEKNAKNS